MHNSFIYSDIFNQLGYFDPGQKFTKLADVNYTLFNKADQKINEDTVIAYYPGCFAEFHDGHVSVIEQFKNYITEITDNYIIVIAPANTDYTVSKYGQSVYASNKYRYDKIVEKIKGYQGNVAIDLNPMLNNDRDYNFTDLLKDFAERHVGAFVNLKNAPFVLCGKDRHNFTKLQEFTNKINVFYVYDITQLSSSNTIKTHPKPFIKKTCYLRCNNLEQYECFKSFFQKQYTDIIPLLLKEELKQANKLAIQHGATVTICKEYANFLPYVPFHRNFQHPLLTFNTHIGDTPLLINQIVLDSDTFTGGTRTAIEQLGSKLVSVFNFEYTNDECELVDFNDFYDNRYRYPHYDISTRCSLPPFTKEDHARYNDFMDIVQSGVSKRVE